jgi:hypothetical protein
MDNPMDTNRRYHPQHKPPFVRKQPRFARTFLVNENLSGVIVGFFDDDFFLGVFQAKARGIMFAQDSRAHGDSRRITALCRINSALNRQYPI